jgi:hypothetical protein
MRAMTALQQARALGVEFGAQLANHAAMVLHAQRRLGGTEAEAQRFLGAYLRTTGLAAPVPSPAAVTRTNWADHLGDRAYESAYRTFFRDELARLGSAAGLLRAYLPALLPGMAASALHALMRLAYALDADEPDEVAEALAYWSACFLGLGRGIGAPPVTADPVEVLAMVARRPALATLQTPSPLLWHFMRHAAAQPDFAPVVDWLEVREDTLDRIARDNLRLFAATMEFCALHAVTGAHWLRLILPALDPPDRARAIRHFWQAIASLYPKMGCPAPLTAAQAEAQRALPCPDWGAIAAAARASDDEHDLSLVWSAREEHRHRGDRLYQVVAARRMGLLAP